MSCAQGLNFAGVSQTLAAGVPQLEQLLAGCADHKPPLRKADIEFRTKASGERIVLGGGAFSTVSRCLLSANCDSICQLCTRMLHQSSCTLPCCNVHASDT